jgi:hypothetical protein
MRIPSFFIALAALSCTACGGNSLSTPLTPSSAPQIVSSPAPVSSNQPSVQSAQTVQTAVQTVTSAINAAGFQMGLYNGTSGAPLRPAPLPPGIVIPPDGACHNGQKLTVTTAAQTTYELQNYYDAGCTQIARDIVSVVTGTPATQIHRTTKTYNAAGLLLATRDANYTVSTGTQAGAYTATLFNTATIGSPSASVQPNMSNSAQWSVIPQSSTVDALSGSTAQVYNDTYPSVSAALGYSRQINNASETFNADGSVTFAETLTNTNYRDDLNALSISAAAPFTISSSTNTPSIGSSTLQGSSTFAVNGTLIGGATLNVVSSTTPAFNLTGTVTSSANASVASFQTDAYGNGVITYANGFSARITDWQLAN